LTQIDAAEGRWPAYVTISVNGLDLSEERQIAP
jgi:hypothetical protein